MTLVACPEDSDADYFYTSASEGSKEDEHRHRHRGSRGKPGIKSRGMPEYLKTAMAINEPFDSTEESDGGDDLYGGSSPSDTDSSYTSTSAGSGRSSISATSEVLETLAHDPDLLMKMLERGFYQGEDEAGQLEADRGKRDLLEKLQRFRIQREGELFERQSKEDGAPGGGERQPRPGYKYHGGKVYSNGLTPFTATDAATNATATTMPGGATRRQKGIADMTQEGKAVLGMYYERLSTPRGASSNEPDGQEEEGEEAQTPKGEGLDLESDGAITTSDDEDYADIYSIDIKQVPDKHKYSVIESSSEEETEGREIVTGTPFPREE